MSDLMLTAVLSMPYDMAMADDLSRRQFYDRAQQALEEIERLTTERDELRRQLAELTAAAIRYDAAIQSCANDPERMSSVCTAEGDDLDALYDDWIGKARVAMGLTRPEEE
jgi:hypothetical protein